MADESQTNPKDPGANEKPSPPGIFHAQVLVPFPELFIYSNASATSISMFDFRVGFAEIMTDGKAQPRVGIVMPPEHAALLTMNLMQQLVAFEDNFGPIRFPAWAQMRQRAESQIGPLVKAWAEAKSTAEPKSE